MTRAEAKRLNGRTVIKSTQTNSPSSNVSSRVDGLMSDPPTKMLSIAH